MSDKNLREKKKNATRQALAEAAFELAIERGVDSFIVEDIASKAGYSRRTFANYFSCKEEAIANALTLPDFSDKGDEYSLEGLTPLCAIELLIKHSFTIDKLKRLSELISLSRGHSTLKLYVTSVLIETQEYARYRISDEFGNKYPNEDYQLLIGAVFGAIMPILEKSINVHLPVGDIQMQNNKEFDAYMKKVFTKLREGFK